MFDLKENLPFLSSSPTINKDEPPVSRRLISGKSVVNYRPVAEQLPICRCNVAKFQSQTLVKPIVEQWKPVLTIMIGECQKITATSLRSKPVTAILSSMIVEEWLRILIADHYATII